MIDEPILDKALGGDAEAFENLLQPYRRSILSVAYHMTGNIEDAKEISQDAIIKIFKYLGSFDKQRDFKNWVLKIVMNTANDFWKKRKKLEDIIDAQKQDFVHRNMENPEHIYIRTEIKTLIRRCLRVLSPREKAVFLLRDGEGLSIKETSGVLGYSSSSVRTHLCRARRKIRFEMEQIVGGEKIGGV